MTAAESTVESAGSWADSVAARVKRAPIPEALVYIPVAVLLVLVLEASQWASGEPVGTVRPIHIALASMIPTIPWLISIFNRSATDAVRSAASLVIGGPERAERLAIEIARAPRLLSIAPAIVFVPLAYIRINVNTSFLSTLGFSTEPPALWVELLYAFVLVAFISAFMVKVGSLAVGVHRITTHEVRVDIWDVSPLLAFSTLTGKVSASIIGVLTALALANPNVYSDAFGIGGLAVALGFATLVFLLPLRGLHERLVVAKHAAQTDAARHMEQAMVELKTAMASGEMTKMDPLNKAMAALEIGGRWIDKVPTWPWSPETFRWIVGALMFPIVLFVAQLTLNRVLP